MVNATIHLTNAGRQAFLAYLDTMQKLLEAVATERSGPTPNRRGR